MSAPDQCHASDRPTSRKQKAGHLRESWSQNQKETRRKPEETRRNQRKPKETKGQRTKFPSLGLEHSQIYQAFPGGPSSLIDIQFLVSPVEGVGQEISLWFDVDVWRKRPNHESLTLLYTMLACSGAPFHAQVLKMVATTLGYPLYGIVVLVVQFMCPSLGSMGLAWCCLIGFNQLLCTQKEGKPTGASSNYAVEA